MHQFAGHCHCGALRVILETDKSAAELPLRACQCAFCKSRGALTTSDPRAHLFIEAAPGSVNHYRFGHRVTDFLLCEECGAYVAAVCETANGLMGVVNVRGAQLAGFEGRDPDPMTYDDETAGDRLARRAQRWSPAQVVEAQPSI